LTSLIMSSCCTLRLKRRRAFSRDSPSCSRISAKQTHPQTRPEGPNSYYKDSNGSQGKSGKKEGENAIAKNREVMGATNPEKAAAGTIRKEFALSMGENSAHGSDAPETAAQEIPFFFSSLDLV